jgi:hypothetical protein
VKFNRGRINDNEKPSQTGITRADTQRPTGSGEVLALIDPGAFRFLLPELDRRCAFSIQNA